MKKNEDEFRPPIFPPQFNHCPYPNKYENTPPP